MDGPDQRVFAGAQGAEIHGGCVGPAFDSCITVTCQLCVGTTVTKDVPGDSGRVELNVASGGIRQAPLEIFEPFRRRELSQLRQVRRRGWELIDLIDIELDVHDEISSVNM